MKSSPSPTALIILGAAMALGLGVVAVTAAETPQRSGQVERGYRVAARECAVCHAIEGPGPSPHAGAPSFQSVRGRYNAVSLSRELDSIRKVGHFEMPAKPISQSDGEDLIAYIQDRG